MEVKLQSPAPAEAAKEVMEARDVREVRVVMVGTPYFLSLRGFPLFPHQKISRPANSRLNSVTP